MKTQEFTTAFERNIEIQLGSKENKVYDVFVCQNDYRRYMELPYVQSEIKMMQKMYIACFDGEVLSLCTKISISIAELLEAAGVSTLEELN